MTPNFGARPLTEEERKDLAGRMTKQLAQVALPRGPSLYEIEDDLLALVNTEEEVTPEQEEAFKLDLARQLQAATAKRDRFAGSIKAYEYTAENIAEEISRLTKRKQAFVNAAAKLRSIGNWVIQALGKDDDGKWRKLRGTKFTLSLQGIRDSVKVEYESMVPDSYKRVRVDMPAEQWHAICERLAEPYPVASYYIDSAKLKDALEAGETVEGATLETDRVTLQIR